jgi:hypothetical protein
VASQVRCCCPRLQQQQQQQQQQTMAALTVWRTLLVLTYQST